MEWHKKGLRQKPGPKNALGFVKFVFPNTYDIYLHDTPYKASFDAAFPQFSHGCINISPTNARWFFDNFGAGDPIIVKNSTGTYTKKEGSSDWQS